MGAGHTRGLPTPPDVCTRACKHAAPRGRPALGQRPEAEGLSLPAGQPATRFPQSRTAPAGRPPRGARLRANGRGASPLSGGGAQKGPSSNPSQTRDHRERLPEPGRPAGWDTPGISPKGREPGEQRTPRAQACLSRTCARRESSKDKRAPGRSLQGRPWPQRTARAALQAPGAAACARPRRRSATAGTKVSQFLSCLPPPTSGAPTFLLSLLPGARAVPGPAARTWCGPHAPGTMAAPMSLPPPSPPFPADRNDQQFAEFS